MKIAWKTETCQNRLFIANFYRFTCLFKKLKLVNHFVSVVSKNGGIGKLYAYSITLPQLKDKYFENKKNKSC